MELPDFSDDGLTLLRDTIDDCLTKTRYGVPSGQNTVRMPHADFLQLHKFAQPHCSQLLTHTPPQAD